MRHGVGIDLGTSFASAAVSGPQGTRMVPLSPGVVVPSVAYPAPDGSVLTGPAALAAAADPASVARNFKRRLGDPTPLVLGGGSFSPTTLMTAQLRDVLTTVTRATGARPASIVLTCPAIWGPYRRDHFVEVAKLAGLTDYRLITEPEAAATHYSAERRLGDGEVVAVYDLGGGTFDTTILRMRSGGMEILGVPEGIEHMGGIDFDETLLAHVDDRLDGAISELDPEDPSAASALATIRTMCVRAKEELSIEPDVTLSVPLPSGPREVTITRLEFNDMIRPSVKLTTDALRRTISSAGVRPDELSAVLLAGGSSRIPLVSQLVSEEFGKPVRVTLHPKFTVALGAAAVAAHAPVTAPPRQATFPTSTPPAGFTAPPKKKWLVPTMAATIVVIVAAVTTLLLTSGGGQAQEAGTPTTVAAGPAPQTMKVFDGNEIKPWVGLVSSTENWSGTQFDDNGANQGPINATRDVDGLRVVWRGSAAQVYLQSNAGTRDLRSYVDNAGALVFDVTVHKPPTGLTNLAVHCEYPCGAQVSVTTLFQQMPQDQKTTVKVPLSCFVEGGLKPQKVNTPFLVYTEQPFDATFSDIRWEAGAATDKDATPCAKLH